MSLQRFFFLGRPPLAPLARAASALALDMDCPPSRPSATAAGFLRGMSHSVGDGEGVIDEQAHVRLRQFVAGRRNTKNGIGFVGVNIDAPWAIDLPNAENASGGVCRRDVAGVFPVGGDSEFRKLRDDLVGSDVVHAPNIPNRLGYVNTPEIGPKRRERRAA